MTESTAIPFSPESQPTGLARRSFLAATVGAVGLAASKALARDYGPNAQPVRYPDRIAGSTLQKICARKHPDSTDFS